MGQYCDTKLLEATWGHWLRTKDSPSLENLRLSGLLWVRVTKDDISYCVPTANKVIFKDSDCSSPDVMGAVVNAITSPICDGVTAQLKSDNYQLDMPSGMYWHQLFKMVYSICNGLALKFNPPGEEERAELTNEALQQVVSKIQRGKLRYTAGRAPVFNLLTTAIIRIMCSIKNKEKRQRYNQSKLTNEIVSGRPLPKLRSLIVSRSGIKSDAIKTG